MIAYTHLNGLILRLRTPHSATQTILLMAQRTLVLLVLTSLSLVLFFNCERSSEAPEAAPATEETWVDLQEMKFSISFEEKALIIEGAEGEWKRSLFALKALLGQDSLQSIVLFNDAVSGAHLTLHNPAFYRNKLPQGGMELPVVRTLEELEYGVQQAMVYVEQAEFYEYHKAAQRISSRQKVAYDELVAEDRALFQEAWLEVFESLEAQLEAQKEPVVFGKRPAMTVSIDFEAEREKFGDEFDTYPDAIARKWLIDSLAALYTLRDWPASYELHGFIVSGTVPDATLYHLGGEEYRLDILEYQK